MGCLPLLFKPPRDQGASRRNMSWGNKSNTLSKGLARYCKAETTFTFYFTILPLSRAFLSINNREMKSESGFSFAMASQPFGLGNYAKHLRDEQCSRSRVSKLMWNALKIVEKAETAVPGQGHLMASAAWTNFHLLAFFWFSKDKVELKPWLLVCFGLWLLLHPKEYTRFDLFYMRDIHRFGTNMQCTMIKIKKKLI